MRKKESKNKECYCKECSRLDWIQVNVYEDNAWCKKDHKPRSVLDSSFCKDFRKPTRKNRFWKGQRCQKPKPTVSSHSVTTVENPTNKSMKAKYNLLLFLSPRLASPKNFSTRWLVQIVVVKVSYTDAPERNQNDPRPNHPTPPTPKRGR